MTVTREEIIANPFNATWKAAEEAVAKGAALLDEKMPGWADKIDLEDLQLASGERCVLGQLFPEEQTLRTPDGEVFCAANFILGTEVLGLGGMTGEYGFTQPLLYVRVATATERAQLSAWRLQIKEQAAKAVANPPEGFEHASAEFIRTSLYPFVSLNTVQSPWVDLDVLWGKEVLNRQSPKNL